MRKDLKIDQDILDKELWNLVLGYEIGYGRDRTVYMCALNTSFVIKVEYGERSFQNRVEWETWEYVSGGPYEKWFAPCNRISPCGTLLFQKRTTPVQKLPKKLPAFFTDLKCENFGMFEGRLVCHDYGTIAANIRRTFTKKTQTVPKSKREWD